MYRLLVIYIQLLCNIILLLCMNFEIIAFIVVLVPFFWVLMFKQEKLKNDNVFLRYLLLSILVMGFGILYEYELTNMEKSMVYFISQMTFIFVVLYKIIRIPYYLIFKREPEISEYPEKWIDYIPTLIVALGTLILPFLIDTFIIQKIIE